MFTSPKLVCGCALHVQTSACRSQRRAMTITKLGLQIALGMEEECSEMNCGPPLEQQTL